MATRDEVVARLTAPGAPYEIGREDVRGQQLEVFTRRQRSLAELVRDSARFGEREYLVSTDDRVTFTEHHARVAALATALREEYAVRPGDRVAICAANRPEWVVAFWATVCVGAVAVGMNSMWAPGEMRHGLGLSAPRLIFADARRRALLGEVDLPVVDLDDDLPVLIARHRGAALPDVPVAEDDPAVILFTSGTSGRPKGATHSHRNVIAALWFHLLNDAVAAELGNPPRDRRFLLATPLFHIAALHNLAVIRLAVGDTAVVHLGRFDIDEVLRLVERERVTNWGAVPTMISRLVERAERQGLDDLDLSSLRTISVSSAPSSPTLKDRLRAVLPVAGRTLGTTYGLTESSCAATLATPAELLADPQTVGRAVPTMEVEVRGSDGGPLPPGCEGEVHLRGPLVMLGYWDDPNATAAAMKPEGWFGTGDLGTLRQDGHLYISSRRSDLILRGGENVYPAEVEDQLVTHEAVAECIVMGIPDADFGEAVAAVVVLHDDAVATEADLVEHLRPRLARYKLPTHWVLTATPLPRNATGKVMRREVAL
ncbi:class I adenylate-forming enzyme family protein [Nocardioides sp. YIM 152315]|uniref:class I adenylate-forming enzyme family protein n=1 Tax=Nocardioides sp. YIM 152315 TaxID=3031760 RepID=UPI0023DC78E1|nr:class I adenylate-forming enzyme family protein [Nocardioides sp. YIM 152315]MDF1604740.1 class I adenylate-forming enzyme family protein [Nocardioides sp. YIM 152315]